MGINLKDFKLTDEQIEEFARMLENQEKKKVNLVVEALNELPSKLVRHIEEKGYVNNEHIAYFPEEHAFTGDEFDAFFDLATAFLGESVGEHVDEDCYFDNRLYWMKVEDKVLRFFIMWGQGTAIQLTFEEEEISSDQMKNIEDFNTWLMDYHKKIEGEESGATKDSIL